jgi:hypothetical protein
MKFLLRHRDLITQSCLFFSILVLACAADGIGDLVYNAMMI